jgi:ATPase subunit of ABC transporter with duplicated ATPase domains
MLQRFPGTCIIVSHDVEILRHCIDTFWSIEEGRVQVFSGGYDDYIHERCQQRQALEAQLVLLKREQKGMHKSLMFEQQRAKKSKIHGEKKYAGDTLLLRAKQAQGEKTKNRHNKRIVQTKADIVSQLSGLRLPDSILPKFSLTASQIAARTLVSIHAGSVGYLQQEMLLNDINFSVKSRDRIAIAGDNGSGKTTLLKAILGDPCIITSGEWSINVADMGYLDQHYATLSADKTVLETIAVLQPSWSHIELRRHLIDFLFRSNAQVETLVADLSGGEKARLSLAQIAARTPKLLILDEISNNLDLETRAHVISILREYPAAMLIISHDEDLLKSIDIQQRYTVVEGSLG